MWDLWETSYVDIDTNEVSVFTGSYEQVLEVYEAWKKSRKIYGDMKDLKMHKI